MRARFVKFSSKLKTGNYIFVAKLPILEKSPSEIDKTFRYALRKIDAL